MTVEFINLGGGLGLDGALLRLLQGLLPLSDLLPQHLEVLQLPLGLLQRLVERGPPPLTIRVRI